MNADSISTATSTNKFTTQSDINKLSGIESGAEANNISDANATALTNNGDTSIHYHSSDRIRSNHTGTQPASTISDFNTAVAGTPSVTANTAKVSFPEAPNDGSYYARKSLGWSPVLYTESTIFLENPTAPNVIGGDNSTKVANTSFVKNNPATAKAWVSFNGIGTVLIRSSYNVSSITDNGVGNYTINFATAMADQNYVVAPFCRDVNDIGGVSYAGQNASYAQNVNFVQLNSSYAGTLYDVPLFSAVIFGN